MSFRNTSYVHRPSRLRIRKGILNAQYFEECAKIAKRRTDAYLLSRLMKQVEHKAEMVILKTA